MEKHPLEIPLGFYDTKPPQSAGPVGRLTTLQNATVQKFRTGSAAGAPPSLKVQKRAGFAALSQDVFFPNLSSSPALPWTTRASTPMRRT